MVPSPPHPPGRAGSDNECALDVQVTAVTLHSPEKALERLTVWSWG